MAFSTGESVTPIDAVAFAVLNRLAEPVFVSEATISTMGLVLTFFIFIVIVESPLLVKVTFGMPVYILGAPSEEAFQVSGGLSSSYNAANSSLQYLALCLHG